MRIIRVKRHRRNIGGKKIIVKSHQRKTKKRRISRRRSPKMRYAKGPYTNQHIDSPLDDIIIPNGHPIVKYNPSFKGYKPYGLHTGFDRKGNSEMSSKLVCGKIAAMKRRRMKSKIANFVEAERRKWNMPMGSSEAINSDFKILKEILEDKYKVEYNHKKALGILPLKKEIKAIRLKPNQVVMKGTTKPKIYLSVTPHADFLERLARDRITNEIQTRQALKNAIRTKGNLRMRDVSTIQREHLKRELDSERQREKDFFSES